MIDEPGTYVLTTTDPNNGCTAVASVLVTEDIAPPSLNATPPSVLSCLTSAQTLQVQNLSLPGNFTYNWTASNGGNIVSGGNGLNPLVDTQGTYQLLATNIANGCTASLTVTVVENIAAPSIQIASAGQITCTNPTQTIQAQNLSLPGNFVYNWTASNGGNITGGNGTLMPQVNMGGDYLLVATNSDNGCTSTASVNVVQDNAAPTADAGADATLTCNLSTLTINGTGAGSNNLTYAWVASNGGNILTGGNSATPTINSPGLFTLTVTNAINGCTASDVVEIFNDASAPTVNAGTAPQLTCSLTQTSLNATASTGNNFSYSWTASNGGNILTGINTLSPTVNEPGLYTLVVTNTTNGCTRSSTVTLTEDITPPTVDAGQGATLTCATTSLSLTGTSGGGSATFAWQTAGGNIVSGGNTLTPTINGTGTYTLITTLLSNGCTASDVVMVGIDTISPTFTIQQPQQITCALTSISLNASVQQPAAGSFSASWSSVSGHFVSGQNSLNPVVDAQGTYILTVVNNQNGCDEALAIPVFQNILAPNAQAAPGGTITCAVQNLTLSGAGSSGPNGVTYLWTASNGGQLLNGMNTLTPTVGSSGTYTLLVTNNNNGCTATATTTVQNNTTAPTAAVSQPGTLTCSQTTVTLNATGSSTGANFSANWSGNILSGQGTLTPVVNASGTYILTITNSTNGCSSTAQSTVAQNTTLPGADAGLPAELHCNLPVAPITGSSPSPGTMTYSWSTQNGSIQSGASNQTAMVNAPGQYSLTVTNPANGCTSTDVVAVTEIPAPDFEAEIMQPDCHNLNGMLDFGGITGGKGPFEYSIDGGQSYGNQSIINGLTPDTYTLVVSDALGCTASETAVVNQPFIPLLEIADIGTIDFGDSIQLNPTTNILPGGVISWAWSPASGLSCIDCENPWAKPYTSTVYFLTVRDQNGCEAEAEVRILVKRNRSVYAPNVFSPNDDGLNDYFVLFGKGVKTIQKLQVFDRWGDAIYQGEQLEPGDEPAGWDGTYKGTAMNPAVFVWWAKVEFIDGEVEFFSGDVTLLR
jgi:gliding motility-associated-like protein